MSMSSAFDRLGYYSWEQEKTPYYDFFLNKKHTDTLSETVRIIYDFTREADGLRFVAKYTRDDGRDGLAKEDSDITQMLKDSGREVEFFVPYPEPVYRFPLTDTFE